MTRKASVNKGSSHTVTLATLIVVVGVTTLVAAAATVRYISYLEARDPSVPSPVEHQWLERHYGPGRHSFKIEEWIIRDALNDRRDGVFVDVGAADPRENSNTFYLERVLGWSGLAIDAQPSFREAYQRHRPKTIFEAFFVSDVSDANVTFYTGQSPLIASTHKEFTERFGPATAQTVRTVRLTDLLDRHRIAVIDFLNVDVELAEPKVLAGFDIARFKPGFVCIEAHPEVRQQILDYFTAADYVIAGKYLRVDDDNLYFIPRGRTIPRFPGEVERAWSLGH